MRRCLGSISLRRGLRCRPQARVRERLRLRLSECRVANGRFCSMATNSGPVAAVSEQITVLGIDPTQLLIDAPLSVATEADLQQGIGISQALQLFGVATRLLRQLGSMRAVAAPTFAQAVLSCAATILASDRPDKDAECESFFYQLLVTYYLERHYQLIPQLLLVLSGSPTLAQISGRMIALSLRVCEELGQSRAEIISILKARMETSLGSSADAWNALLMEYYIHGDPIDFDATLRRINSNNLMNGTTLAIVAAWWSKRADETSSYAIVLDSLNNRVASPTEMASIASSAIYACTRANQVDYLYNLRLIISNNPERIARLGLRSVIAVMHSYIMDDNAVAAAATARLLLASAAERRSNKKVDYCLRSNVFEEPLIGFLDSFDAPDPELLDSVLQGLCREKRLADAGENFLALASFVQPRWLHIILSELAVEGHYKLAFDILRLYALEGLPAIAATFVVTLKTLSSLPRSEVADVVDSIQELKSSASKLPAHTEADATTKDRWLLLADTLLQAMPGSEVILLDYESRKKLSARMTELRIEPRWPQRLFQYVNWALESTCDLAELVVRLFGIPLIGVSESNALEIATSKVFSRETALVFQHLADTRGALNPTEYLAVLSAARVEPTMTSFNILMRRATKSVDLLTANMLFNRMLELRVAPLPDHPDAYREYFLFLANMDQTFSQALPNVAHMLRAGITPNSRFVVDVLKRAFWSDQVSAWRLWDLFHQTGVHVMSAEVYGAVLFHLAGMLKEVSWFELQSAHERMLLLLSSSPDRADAKAVAMNEAPLNNAMARGAALRNETKIAMRFIAKIPLSMYLERAQRYADLAGSIAAQGDFVTAFRIVRKLHASGYVPRDAIVRIMDVCCTKSAPEIFADAVSLMAQLGISPDPKIFCRLLIGASLFGAGGTDALTQTWQAAKKSGFGTDGDVLLQMTISLTRSLDPSGLVTFYRNEVKPLIVLEGPHASMAGRSGALPRVLHRTATHLLQSHLFTDAMPILSDALRYRLHISLPWWIALYNAAGQTNTAFWLAEDKAPLQGVNVFGLPLTQIIMGMFFAMRYFAVTENYGDSDLVHAALRALVKAQGQPDPPSVDALMPLIMTNRQEQLIEAIASLNIQPDNIQFAAAMQEEYRADFLQEQQMQQ